ncbi:MAG TPA: FAD-dependent oxidoreductase, partial [Pyrinomonadaceae bacterium]|nr:FAD-dependent oxidoreductase [Pyrinomonadaceae bacterium]
MYDVIIIGAGPAGLSAALWCDELGLDTLVLEQSPEIGGQLLQVYNRVTNHLGVIEAENGREMRDVFAAQISEAEFDLWTGAEIERVDLGAKRVVLRGGEALRAVSVVIATGV